MKVILHDKCLWEPDYIRYDLLKEFPELTYICLDTKQLLDIHTYKDIGPIIFVFSTLKVKFDEIEPIVKYTKPQIIIQCSDEFGNDPRWLTLANDTKLILKQYNHRLLNITNHPKILQIPLGYMKNIFFQKESLEISVKPIKDRLLTWSFCGTVNKDRDEMLTVFKKWLPTHAHRFNLPPQDMFDIYKNSIFVPNGRGATSLDCFRLYEAILAGAIPVAVGSEEELNTTFSYNGDRPFFVFAKDWIEAVKLCTTLLKSPDLLQKLQEELIAWWKRHILEIREHVSLALTHP